MARCRSYGMDLLRWFRVLWVRVVSWDRVTRAEARVTRSHWLQVSGKPRPCAEIRAHQALPARTETARADPQLPRDGPEPVTGFSAAIKEPPG